MSEPGGAPGEEHQPMPAGKQVKMQLRFPGGTEAHYATVFIAQADRSEIIISFFQPLLPVVMGTPEERLAQLAQIDTVPADCVGRIVVAVERLPELIAILNESLENHRTTYGPAAKSTE